MQSVNATFNVDKIRERRPGSKISLGLVVRGDPAGHIKKSWLSAYGDIMVEIFSHKI